MNCPSRTDHTEDHPDWNQNPSALNADATTRADLNGITNARQRRSCSIDPGDQLEVIEVDAQTNKGEDTSAGKDTSPRALDDHRRTSKQFPDATSRLRRLSKNLQHVLGRYAQFVGPGLLIAVAYIDPGNYATDVGAGAATRFSLLFIVLLSNLFAIFLQSLCIKLGSVTGMNLAESCRENLPKWLTIVLYILAESAIIATDIAEVIGSAIALNLLLHIPIVAGCAITIVDVLIILIFYHPNGSMRRIRIFEYFVMVFVFAIFVCFCIQLSYVENATVGEVFRGFLPSAAVVTGNGIYLSCGVLGATVMPHSLYLGSEVCQPRLRHFEISEGGSALTELDESSANDDNRRPAVALIRSCLRYSIFELAFSLFTFAFFINSAILIVAGSALYGNSVAASADLFGIHQLLSRTLAPVAGTIFALALLFSGLSAGIVCTMAGQIVSDGFLNWTIKPWIRRLITRTISIIPSIIIAAAVGKSGLDNALVASQVVLSVILPIVSTPLLWFTCRKRVMTITDREGVTTNMQNGWVVTILAFLIWLVLVVMNVALLVLLGLGKA